MQPDQAKLFMNFFTSTIDNETPITKKVIGAIPEDKRDYKPAEKSRTAMEIAWHLVSSEIWFLDGLASGEFGPEAERPAGVTTVAGILAWYEERLAPAIAKVKALPAEKLAAKIPFFGVMNESLVAYLNMMIVHSVHHRGQLSAYLRPMGAKVPDIYGGSADEPFQMPAGI
jgi:uncharacterized damage-inducible protein DinB